MPGQRPSASLVDQLVESVRSAKAADVYALVAAVEDVNALSSDGDAPLVACASCGRLDVLGKLMSAGASPDAACSSGMSALAAAAMSGHLVCVRKLLDAGADVNLLCGQGNATALIYAAQEGHRSVCECLLEAGGDAHAKDAYGMSALAYAKARELDGIRQSAEFERWAKQLEARAAAIEAEAKPPKPPFAYKLKEELQRCHTNKEPTSAIWRPGEWVHQKRPPSEAVVEQTRGRPFNPTGYLEPIAPRVERVGSLAHFGLQDNAVAPSPAMPPHMAALAPPSVARVADAALGRSSVNPEVFPDDVEATRTGMRTGVLDAAGTLRVSAKQDIYLKAARRVAAFPGVPVRHHGAPLYAGQQLQTLISVDSAAATLTPVLTPPSGASLPEMLAKPKTTTAEVLEVAK